MVKVNFFDPEFVPEGKLTYSVIAASFRGEWLFVKHRLRDTWEIPGGHIEEGESSSEAASRELTEETGALDFDLECVATYSVEKEGKTGYGRLYFAEVKRSGAINDDSEIEEVMLSDHLPNDLTYPDIQPGLFLKVLDFLADNK
ncbi:MAG: NUDIX domain-containing protein [Bacteroidales bacterium]|jgi:8-oxo-dGTP diphosphatase|nr:NUDIX domain-containing protein [Bacteroidales bacterium]